jgi:hypothetical protein
MKILIVREFQKPILRPFYDQIAEALPKICANAASYGINHQPLMGICGHIHLMDEGI